MHVIDHIGRFTSDSLVSALVSDLERQSDLPATAYGIHVGNLNEAIKDPRYRQVLADATHLYADGTATRLVSSSLGRVLPQRLVTTDLIWPVLRASAEGGHSVYFLGGAEDLAGRAAAVFANGIPGLRIAGSASGYFPIDRGDTVAEAIALSKAHLVVVCMGVPREQIFCCRFGHLTGARLLMTAGGLYGYILGLESRAPTWMRNAGLEWFFRLAQSPTRLFPRYAAGSLTTARLVCAAREQRRHG